MRDGYYLITTPAGKRIVEYVYQHRTDKLGSVHELKMQGCKFEEVEIHFVKGDGQVVTHE